MTQRKMKDAHERDSIMPGANPAVTDEELIEYLESGVRPVYTAPNVAERFDITRQTAHRRLKELSEEYPHIAVTNIGQADAYYVPGVEVIPPGDTEEERLKQSIKQWANDRFVGLHQEPWTAIHPNDDGPATAGDKIQLLIRGQPGLWNLKYTTSWDARREQMQPIQRVEGQTDALVSGELYAKPTVPIRHLDLKEDYDLELNLGTRFETIRTDKEHERRVLLATGVRNYELQACDDAVFLTNAKVDWISPPTDGQDALTKEEREKLQDDLSWFVEQKVDGIEKTNSYEKDDWGEDDDNE